MQIWPAIDLRGGKCVRLEQGDYRSRTVFAMIRRRWPGTGSPRGHAACTWSTWTALCDGRPTNLPAVEKILAAVDVPCELGGGIRDEQTVRQLLAAGLSRLVIGTRALAEPEWFRRLCREVPDRLVLGIDARDGQVATDGWLRTSGVSATELAPEFSDEPLAAIIYTDIATDGMLCGPNLAAMRRMRDATRLPVIASGGIHAADDVRSWPRSGWPAASSGGPCTSTNSRCARHWPRPKEGVDKQISWCDSADGVLSMITHQAQGMLSWLNTKSRTSATSFSAGTARPARPCWPTRCSPEPEPINHPASVDAGTSICDFDEEEKHHKHTIESSLIHFNHGGRLFNVIDTPGYPDFIGQTIAAMREVDMAAIFVNAHSGVEVNTRRVFQEAGKAGLGRMIIISKMDSENIDFPALLKEIRAMFGNACVPLNVPIGSGHDFKGVISTLNIPADTKGALAEPGPINEALLEAIIEVDEAVTERYSKGSPPRRKK